MIPDTLRERRALVSSLLSDYRHFNRVCACGHARVWHGYYLPRPDGEFEECFPVHTDLAPCVSAMLVCEVCDCAGYAGFAADSP